MKSKTLITSFFSLLLFLAGILLQIWISAAVLWGEMEARSFTSSSVDRGLSLKCPHFLSFDEPGTITASISNPQNQEAQPMITAQISRNGSTQQMSQTVTLPPHHSTTVQWSVDASNNLFGRLILVNVLQGKDGDLPAKQGSCGIFLLNLLGMSGQEAFILLCVTSFALLILSAVIWLRGHLPLNGRDRNIAHAFVTLAVVATLGFLAALLRWWGFIMILDTLTLILLVVIFTDVLLNPQERRL